MSTLKDSPQAGWLRRYLWRAIAVLTVWAVAFAVVAGNEKEQDGRIVGLIASIDERRAAMADIDFRITENQTRYSKWLDAFYREPGRSANECPPKAVWKSFSEQKERLVREREKTDLRVARLQEYLAVARSDCSRAFTRWLAIAVSAGLAAVVAFYLPFRKRRGGWIA